jgi:hypothetical protein
MLLLKVTRVLSLPSPPSSRLLSFRTPLPKSTNRALSASAMARDTTLQTDIGLLARITSADGSFKRKDAAFRSHVTKGGEFAPEKGALDIG